MHNWALALPPKDPNGHPILPKELMRPKALG